MKRVIARDAVPENPPGAGTFSNAAWSRPSFEDFAREMKLDGSFDSQSADVRGRIARFFAHADSLPPASFSDLSLPHHEPATGATNLPAVRNALARIDQTSMSGADKAAAKAHLEAHLEAAKKDELQNHDALARRLAKNGRFIDTAVFAKDARVEETDDFWVIPDSVFSQPGVYNNALREKQGLADSWILANGVPIVHDHPDPGNGLEGMVDSLGEVAGFTDNARFDDQGRILVDAYLLKRSIDGLAITPEGVKRNGLVVAALRAGADVETSPGYVCDVQPAAGELDGAEYDQVRTGFVWDHYAIVPRGACSASAGCGLGKGQTHDHAASGAPSAAPGKDGNKMPAGQQDCNQDELQRRLKDAEARADAAEKAVKASADARAALDQDMNAKLDALAKRLDETTAKAAAADKARVDAKRAELATLTNVDAAKLPEMTEAALDFAITRERTFHASGRADGTRHRGAAGDAKPEAGIVMTENGMTVADWGEAVTAARAASGVRTSPPKWGGVGGGAN
ncbi:MAG: DUF2213 domain-containing protein [Thermoplasmatota archaeon]